jgi:hypothetical protein
LGILSDISVGYWNFEQEKEKKERKKERKGRKR